VFKGNFFRWDGNVQEYPFAEWNCNKFAWKANSHATLLFSGVGNWLFLTTGMVTTLRSQVIAHGIAILWHSKLFLPRGTATTQCNPGPLFRKSWDNKLRMVNYMFVIVIRKRINGKSFSHLMAEIPGMTATKKSANSKCSNILQLI
jgi:hypothetical protein